MNFLCWVCLLSGAPSGPCSSSVPVVSFIQPQTAMWSGQTQNLFTWLARLTNSPLCLWFCVSVSFRGVFVRDGGRVTCGSVAQSWSWVRHHPVAGQKTSNQQTAGRECGGRGVQKEHMKNMWQKERGKERRKVKEERQRDKNKMHVVLQRPHQV